MKKTKEDILFTEKFSINANGDEYSYYENNHYIVVEEHKENATLIQNVLVDCGTSYKKINDAQKEFSLNLRPIEIDAVVLTHLHKDHFVPSTLIQILKSNAFCIVYLLDEHLNEFEEKMLSYLDTLSITEHEKCRMIKHIMNSIYTINGDEEVTHHYKDMEYKFNFIVNKHDRFNKKENVLSFELEKSRKKEVQFTLIYATDLISTDKLPIKKYDYVLIETAYDEDELIGLSYSDYALNTKKAHLSKQQVMSYIEKLMTIQDELNIRILHNKKQKCLKWDKHSVMKFKKY